VVDPDKWALDQLVSDKELSAPCKAVSHPRADPGTATINRAKETGFKAADPC